MLLAPCMLLIKHLRKLHVLCFSYRICTYASCLFSFVSNFLTSAYLQ
jgi:hypothetical protein